MSKQKVLTTTEAMEYLRTTRVTVFKMIKDGRLKTNKVGREYRFLKSELDRFLRGETEERKAAAR